MGGGNRVSDREQQICEISEILHELPQNKLDQVLHLVERLEWRSKLRKNGNDSNELRDS